MNSVLNLIFFSTETQGTQKIIHSPNFFNMFDKLRMLCRSTLKKKYLFFGLNDAELFASEIVRKYPPIDTLNINTQNATVEEPYEALIIGFDETGSAILRKLIAATQFVGTHFKATVIVDDPKKSSKQFYKRYPEIKNHYSIEFLKFKTDTDKFNLWLEDTLFSQKQVFIATGNDEKSMDDANHVSVKLFIRNVEDVPVIVVLREMKDQYFEFEDEYPFAHCETIPDIIFTENNVLKSNHLLQAKAVHHFYNQLKPFAQRIPWEQLSTMQKESNIAMAASIYSTLKLMGKTVEEVKQMSEIEFQLFLQENPERLLNLAISEHLRWNATYFTHGWKTWKLSEIPEGAPHQDEKLKLHACLVDWENLKEVEKRFEIPFQNYDYNNVTILRQLLINNEVIV